MKLLLVIDLADDWAEDYKDFTVDYDLRGTPIDDEKVNESIKYVEDADVKPLPERMSNHIQVLGENGRYSRGFIDGWNAYLNVILGDTE